LPSTHSATCFGGERWDWRT